MIKRITFYLYLTVILSLCTLTFAESTPIQSLDVVLDNNYPPYIFYDTNGVLQGILVDEWALFEDKTGIDVTLHALNWGEALDGMKNGEYDVIDTLFINPEREALYTFSAPYADLDVSIFFHKNISGINTLESIKGFSVATKRGDHAATVLAEAGVDNVVLYESYEAIIQAAAENKVVLFVIDNPPAQYFLYKYGLQNDFKQTAPLYTGQFHRAVRKGDAALIAEIESGFSQISKAELEAIQSKWFGKPSFLGGLLPDYIKYFALTTAAILFILIGWNAILRQTVNKKTKALVQVINQLSYSESKLKAIMDALPDWVFILHRDGTIIDFITTTKDKGLLLSPVDFIHHNLSEFFSREHIDLFNKAIEEVLATGVTKPVEYSIHNGDTQHFEARYERLSDDQAIAVVRNITERYNAQRQILDLSIMDVPTGLYNRNYFESQMEEYRSTGLEGLCFLMADFDGLKLVNDTLGHSTGDQYLKTVALLLKSTFKSAQLIARIGGDEFVVVLKDWDEVAVLNAKKQIKESVIEINKTEHTIPFSLSIGYALSGPTLTTIEEMLKSADDYMYREKLFHRQSMRSKNLDTLSAMLNERDFMPQGHGQRLEKWLLAMGKQCNYSEVDLKSLSLLAQFHDIGKIGISDSILFKPYKLTSKEFTEVKRHSEIGFRIAESSSDLLHISEWIYKHHEWWNGQGYPFGLKGEEIPLPCRMLSLADAYDAMTSERPYRSPLTIDEAIEELLKHSGTQFDPHLTELFIRIIQDPDFHH